MPKTIRIPDGLLIIAEYKAVCPYCDRTIPFEEIENKWVKQDNHFIRMKCRCKRLIGIACDMRGDFVGFEL